MSCKKKAINKDGDREKFVQKDKIKKMDLLSSDKKKVIVPKPPRGTNERVLAPMKRFRTPKRGTGRCRATDAALSAGNRTKEINERLRTNFGLQKR